MDKLIKLYIKDLKHNSKCYFCGESEDCCLEFHHINKDNKLFSMGKIPHTKTLEDVKNELNKTICVCANCHRKLHNKLLKYEY